MAKNSLRILKDVLLYYMKMIKATRRLPTLGPVAQRIEVLNLYGSRWALSEDSGFKSYPSRPEVYMVKNVYDRQQLWKAIITGDTVIRLSIPIRGRGKSPEEGQRWNLAETWWKKKQHKNYQDEDKKSAINKKLILTNNSIYY